jgi:hypothetical protein
MIFGHPAPKVTASRKVELVGGPGCGEEVDWPEDQYATTYCSNEQQAVYELIDGEPGKARCIALTSIKN